VLLVPRFGTDAEAAWALCPATRSPHERRACLRTYGTFLGPRQELLGCDDNTLEALRVDGFLHHPALLCLVYDGCERFLCCNRMASRQRGRDANRCKGSGHDFRSRQCFGGRIANARVGPKDLGFSRAQQFSRISCNVGA
jgi:hypothetical protein